MSVNEWYKNQVRELPSTTKSWGKQYKNKFKKNLLKVLECDFLRIDDLCVIAMYLDVDYDNRISATLSELEKENIIQIFHTDECIYISKT